MFEGNFRLMQQIYDIVDYFCTNTRPIRPAVNQRHMRTSRFSRLLLLFSFFLVGCLLIVPAASHAQRQECHDEEQFRTKVPDSRSILKLSKRKGSRVPLSTARRSKEMKASRSAHFTRNMPRGSVNPSDRDQFYGLDVWEMGISGGVTHPFTDVTWKFGQGDFNLGGFVADNVSVTAGLYARNKLSEWFALSVSADAARLSGSNPDGYLYRYGPNSVYVYSFRNDMAELSGRMEFHAPPIGISTLNFYVFGGFAAFISQPEMYDLGGGVIRIEPLPNELYQTSYSPISFALPFGAGLTFMPLKNIRLGYEIGYRYTGNNGIDGAYVLTTPYDAYMFNTVRIGYNFPKRK